MEKRDYYDILGVDRNTGADDLKKAYRKLAMQYHPDRNPGDKDAEHRFKEISQAYDILKDDEKRAAYDRFGHSAFEAAGGPSNAQGAGFDFASSFADIFDEMFGDFRGGRQRGRQTHVRGSDLRYNLAISLEEAYAGKQAKIRVPSSVTCGKCHGSGGEGGSQPTACPACHGHGRVRAQQGFFTIERTCPSCQGQGSIIKKPCRTCGGSGREHKERTLSVSIPKGVEDGTRIRLAGEGEAGMRGGPTGDLYIFLSLKPHRFFQRREADIHCRVPVPMTTAALGGTVEVPTIEGSRARVSVPAGTQTGHQFRLRGKGMSVLRSKSRGDMFVEVGVETPVNLTKRQKELLAEFNKAGGNRSQSPEAEGFFAKVKELWDDLTD